MLSQSKSASMPAPDLKNTLRDYARRLADHWLEQLRKEKRIPKTGEFAEFTHWFSNELWKRLFERAEQLDPSAKEWFLHRKGDDPDRMGPFIMSLSREEAERSIGLLIQPPTASASADRPLDFKSHAIKCPDRKLEPPLVGIKGILTTLAADFAAPRDRTAFRRLCERGLPAWQDESRSWFALPCRLTFWALQHFTPRR